MEELQLVGAMEAGARRAEVASPPVQKIYRPSDDRPIRDDARAAELGIQKYSSKRLILYTDIDPETARALPPVIDQAYEAWVNYFGELPPNREGTEYQITGYLIDDPARFVEAGMLPEGPPMFRFGRQQGAEFWMNKMNSDYYRRHLLIHEATHAFMTTMLQQPPPRWYLEGMAEYFGTHILHEDGRVEFGVFPKKSEDFPGMGRIELIRQELAQGQAASLARLGAFTPAEWDRPVPIPYAWSWAVCEFLTHHPRYQDRFRGLGQHMERNDFQKYMEVHFRPDANLLSAEWDQFSERLGYDIDIAANAFVPHDAPLKVLSSPVEITVPANRSWQSTGLRLVPGSSVRIQAEGSVILSTEPKPWRSEPQGISIRYAAGEPIGKLLAGILPETEITEGSVSRFQVFPIGRDGTIHAPEGGELWLRVNDLSQGISENTGEYKATITPVSSPGGNSGVHFHMDQRLGSGKVSPLGTEEKRKRQYFDKASGCNESLAFPHLCMDDETHTEWLREATRSLSELSSHTLVQDFDSRSLKAIRQRMVERDWCRQHRHRDTINHGKQRSNGPRPWEQIIPQPQPEPFAASRPVLPG